MGIDEDTRLALLRLARTTIDRRLRGRPDADGSGVAAGILAGAFVTLKRDGALRGCIGHIAADQPLGEVVHRCALAAAFEDPRFPPLAADELAAVALEISVLSALHPTRPEDVVVGRDGLLLRADGRSGLLLPQVPVEHGWDRGAFLQHLCRKAGLKPDRWTAPGAELLRFTAVVFGESERQRRSEASLR